MAIVNWVVLTGDDIRLLDTETTIMSSVSPLQDLDTVVASAANYVRGYVKAGGNIMEDAPSVPPECKDDVVAIARANYLAQEPTGTLLTKVRQDERTNALAHLRDIAKDIAAVTQGTLPSNILRFGAWSATPRLAMRTENAPTVPGIPVQTAPGIPSPFVAKAKGTPQ